jgi:hypothetical protein
MGYTWKGQTKAFFVPLIRHRADRGVSGLECGHQLEATVVSSRNHDGLQGISTERVFAVGVHEQEFTFFSFHLKTT